MPLLSERVKEAMEAAGLTVGTLAQQVRKTPSAISQILSGTTKSLSAEMAVGIEAATGYSARWLSTGSGPKQAGLRASESLDEYQVQGGFRSVPLISWVRASGFDEANDPLPAGDAEAWFAVPKRVGANTYALRVRGDSMFNPTGPKSYPEGCIIIVDPDKRSPVSGDVIIAKIAGASDVTFKRYRNEDGRQWLQPLNPSYPRIDDEFRVLGTVVGKWEEP